MTTADPIALIDQSLRTAIHAAFGEGFEDVDPILREAQKREFGDWQANVAMGLGKRLGKPPREVAEAILEHVDFGEVVTESSIAGPGFVNLRLAPSAVAKALLAMDTKDLGVIKEASDRTVAIDMVSVNVAKRMHVGHLRSAVIGDAIARTLERRGRTVIRQNHLGDWGTPIALVLTQLRANGINLDHVTLEDLDTAYREAQANAKADRRGAEATNRFFAGSHRLAELEAQNSGADEVVAAAKQDLVRLQAGDPKLHDDWRKMIDCTLDAVQETIDLLGVRMRRDSDKGESFYNSQLSGVVDSFLDAGKAREDDGAIVVDFPERDRPMIIRKRDGGFLYATTDLAAIRHRTHDLAADRILYIVDIRQRDHFRDVFEASRMLGWDKCQDGTAAELNHLGFGTVLGANGKPLKTRSGTNASLMSLIEEAIRRGTDAVVTRSQDASAPTHGLSEQDLAGIGRAVGIAAIKYADLSSDASKDYVFDMDRMVAFEGDTGPYLLYAHARICSLLDRAGGVPEGANFQPTDPAEKDLGLHLLGYAKVVHQVSDSLEPHHLCGYLHRLAGLFATFYQQCSVLKVEDSDIRASRLRLCDLVRRVLSDGLDLLGMAAPKRM
ncbi:MAG: arginine--tRNA ligase [Phycisphaerae bacterium]|nr:arginine--tRNA ligase [Phycisphaerae bacterium]